MRSVGVQCGGGCVKIRPASYFVTSRVEHDKATAQKQSKQATHYSLAEQQHPSYHVHNTTSSETNSAQSHKLWRVRRVIIVQSAVAVPALAHHWSVITHNSGRMQRRSRRPVLTTATLTVVLASRSSRSPIRFQVAGATLLPARHSKSFPLTTHPPHEICKGPHLSPPPLASSCPTSSRPRMSLHVVSSPSAINRTSTALPAPHLGLVVPAISSLT